MALHDLDIPADSFTGSQAGFLTDTTHTNAKIIEVRPDRVREALDAGRVAVVGGSQGVSTDNDLTFLGRGGSGQVGVDGAFGSSIERRQAWPRRNLIAIESLICSEWKQD